MSTTYDKTSGSRIGRRALLTAGAVVVVGGAVAAAPYAEQRIRDEERALVLAELGQLEGVPIDAAIAVAELTRQAVQAVVLPLALFVAAIGGDALGALLRVVQAAQGALHFIHVSSSVLDQFAGVITSWQTNVAGLPIALDQFVSADIQSAETYLKALKTTIAARPVTPPLFNL
jgi:chromosome condensin MukBEF complex kleisin-like MukF subunit